MLAITNTYTLLAISAGQRNIFESEIKWFDLEALSQTCGGGSTPVDFTVADGESNLSVAFNYFLSRGLTEAMAAGIIGNLRHESGQSTEDFLIIYPNITQNEGFDAPFDANDGHGFGIAQWTWHTRKENLQAFAEATDRPIDALETQLEFIWFELTGQPELDGVNGGGSAGTAYANLVGLVTDDPNVDNAPDVEKASYIFHMDYENDDQAITYRGIPNPTYEDYLTAHDHRNELARDTLNRLAGTGTATSCFANTDGVVNTVLSYAWPEYHASPYLTKKPEYAAAVEAAIANGEYVGSNYSLVYAGVDCGGFVTRVMRDSGHDPNYNSQQGDTGYQHRYLRDNWEQITVNSTADLLPGDVAIKSTLNGYNGHTFIYVGSLPGFNSNVASASTGSVSAGTGWRAPMAGHEGVLDNRYEWFRKGV